MATTSARWTSAPARFCASDVPARWSAIDVYNLFNANPGLTYQEGFVVPAGATTSTTWYNPQTLLMPRFVRFNITTDF